MVSPCAASLLVETPRKPSSHFQHLARDCVSTATAILHVLLAGQKETCSLLIISQFKAEHASPLISRPDLVVTVSSCDLHLKSPVKLTWLDSSCVTVPSWQLGSTCLSSCVLGCRGSHQSCVILQGGISASSPDEAADAQRVRTESKASCNKGIISQGRQAHGKCSMCITAC